jgi:hypothetical protein
MNVVFYGRRMMMKKLLVLLLVLGMASTASATLQISVNGDPEPIDSEITIEPSQEITLDIWTDADISPFGGGPWMLVCDVTLGTIDPGTALPPFVYGAPAPGYTYDNEAVQPPEGMEGIWGIAVNSTITPVPSGTVLYDEIIFHCPAPGDVTIYLMDAPDGSPASIIYDAVVIHQIPEPMTVALLGLGGLFLLRRRK